MHRFRDTARRRIKAQLFCRWVAVLGLSALNVAADEIRIAVASNFLAPAQALVDKFETESGHRLALAPGATGVLFAQISEGAPFAAFLAADQQTPLQLIERGQAVKDSQFTYALGRLVLWSSDPLLLDGSLAFLQRGNFNHLAIANPKVAPYGRAAQELLTKLNLFDALKHKLVLGQNIAQTFQFVSSGNAEIGLISVSQVVGEGAAYHHGSLSMIPADAYSPIVQDAVLLKPEKPDPVAKQFLQFLKGSEAQRIVNRYGYASPKELEQRF